MDRVENFAALPIKDQLSFAEKLVKTINTEKIFADDVHFEITGVETDDFTGGLMVSVSHTDPIEVCRRATWTCDTEDDAEDDPGFEADYDNALIDDTRKAFKTPATVIEGYRVSLEINDVDADATVSIEVTDISHEDDGIGDYEYWGSKGHDSRPYIAVEGTITKSCECSLGFFVEPVDEEPEEVDED
jgi:hypothetical protein